MKSGFERFMWQYMRLSGLVMVILIFFHLIIMHFVNDITAITGQFVADRFAATPIWIIIDLAILVLAWVHGLNGLRIVLMDYLRRSSARRIVFGLALTVVGLAIIDSLMLILGATDTILPYARDYARYILYAAPIMAASFVLNSILRAEGKILADGLPDYLAVGILEDHSDPSHHIAPVVHRI